MRRLVERHGLEVSVPGPAERPEVNRIVFEELVPRARRARLEGAHPAGDASRPRGGGREAVVLGCTELGMLVQQADSRGAPFDTTELHARAAVEWALGSTDERTGLRRARDRDGARRD